MSTPMLLDVAPPLAADWDEADATERDSPCTLVGRMTERRTLADILEVLRGGSSRALLICGEAGIGKTALLDYLEDEARGCRVVRQRAAESERALPYAALNQLCGLLDRMEQLPEPQRAALRTAFGLVPGVAPDPLLLGLAVLSLLAHAAKDGPLLCLIDDAHWMDAQSAVVLGFVARRLASERVAVIFALRDAVPEVQGLPQLKLVGLADGEARALLSATLRRPVDVRVRERLIAEAAGNPEILLGAVSASMWPRLAGGFGVPEAVFQADDVMANVKDRLGTLPDAARLLLLVAAAEPLGDPRLLWRAAEQLGVASGAADALEEAGLLEVGARVTFRHPTARAAVYNSALRSDRRRVHRALALATDVESDPAHFAWHQGCGATGPNEEISSALERSARRAAERGGLAAAAAFLRQATLLTPEAAGRGQRALAAAEATRRAGDRRAALNLLLTAEAMPLDARGRARAAMVRARVASDESAEDAVASLYGAARDLEGVDIDAARETYLDALIATALLGSSPAADPVAVARDALSAHRPGPPRAVDLLLDALAVQVTEGAAAATPAVQQALTAFTDEDLPPDVALNWGWFAAYLAAARWEHGTHEALAERLVRLSRQDGALATLPHSLDQLAAVHMRDGDLAQAATLITEAEAAIDPTGPQRPRHMHTLMAAYRGDEPECLRLMRVAARDSSGPTRGIAAVVAQVAGLVLYNGLGRYDDALSAGRGALDVPEPIGAPAWALPELVEAAVRAGDSDVAAAAMFSLSEQARTCGTDWACGLAARSQALLSQGPEAESAYQEAVALLTSPGSRLDLARARLLFGEWLRREGRRVDARHHLRHADNEFTMLGFEAFAVRARRELRATGATVRKRTTEARDDLTPQELVVAQLARDGLSNPEIGARMFVSPRTVEWHLRKIYGKLGIRSRRALGDALSDLDQALIPPQCAAPGTDRPLRHLAAAPTG